MTGYIQNPTIPFLWPHNSFTEEKCLTIWPFRLIFSPGSTQDKKDDPTQPSLDIPIPLKSLPDLSLTTWKCKGIQNLADIFLDGKILTFTEVTKKCHLSTK